MNVKIYKEAVPSFDAAVIPFSDDQLLNTELPEVISGPVKAALSAGKLAAACGSVYDLNLYLDGSFKKVVLVSLGDGSSTNREVFLAFAKALKRCKDASAAVTEIFLDNAAILPLYENGVTGAVQSYVEGFQMSATSSGYQFNHLVVHK